MGILSVLFSTVGAAGILFFGVFITMGLRNAGDGPSAVMGSGEMFNAIAKEYDFINTALSLGMHGMWRRRMVDSLDLKAGDIVLDAGTGTADVAIAIAKHLDTLKPGTKLQVDTVIGVDPSEGMLSVGREKVTKEGLDGVVRLVHGDAQDLAPSVGAAQEFDAATMAFAIRNVPDRQKAINQIAEHLRPGGKLAVLELCEPSFLPARLFVKFCVPVIGSVLSGGNWREYQHLEKSVLAFNADEFKQVLSNSGLRVLETEMMNFGSVGLYVAEKPSAA